MLTYPAAPNYTSLPAADPKRKLFVVASDGTADSDAAFEMAKLFAGPTGVVRGVAVVDQVNVVAESQVLFSAEIETLRRSELQADLSAQMQRTVGEFGEFDLYDGDAAQLISQSARRSAASMILAGIGRHTMSDRIFGNETVLRIMRTSELPVLAVARVMRHLPRRIVAAIDFSEPSLRALSLAVSLAEPGATVFLTHVGPRDSALYDWDKSYKQNVLDSLRALKAKLDLPASVSFEPVLLQGDPATELLAYAKSVDADLIATGSHGHGFIARLLVGSVATRLVRGTFCSVLAVPQITSRPLATSIGDNGRSGVPASWSALLDDVSRQNFGRLTAIEEDAPGLGAQLEGRMLSFTGASYDPYDGRVQLMFASAEAPFEHLTRSISEVSSIRMLQNQHGQDVTVRIGHGKSQTLLTFQPRAFAAPVKAASAPQLALGPLSVAQMPPF